MCCVLRSGASGRPGRRKAVTLLQSNNTGNTSAKLAGAYSIEPPNVTAQDQDSPYCVLGFRRSSYFQGMENGEINLPDEIPVMPLPGAVLFPHALLPLYIFEPRYRQMLEHALKRDRMFSVALIKPSCPEWQAPEDFFHFATIGLIRACVGRGDGTSNLVLQGLRRVRFTGFEQETPFPVAKIDVIESENKPTVETEALGEKVLELYRKLKRPGRQLP